MLDKNGWISGGSIIYDGRNLTNYKTEREWLTIRGREIAIVMQDPMTSLNPLKTIGQQIGEALALHHGLHGKARREAEAEMLAGVGISDPTHRARQYPHEFSGGMRQRVVIAIAMACRPQILICDEPTTALDVTIQAQILELIQRLREKHRLTVLYITHDLGVVARVADRVAVMYAGDVIEQGTTEEVFFEPAHPYTWALLSSLPQLGMRGEPLYAIRGTPPSLFEHIRGDAFAPRNPRALRVDSESPPPSFTLSKTHSAKTWLLDARAPKIEPPEAITRLREYVV